MIEILLGLVLMVLTGYFYDRANERIARKYTLIYAAALVGSLVLVIDGLRWI